MIDNGAKYINFSFIFKRLNVALKHEFYLQAIFYEYGLLEDRLSSILDKMNISIKEKESITKKIEKIQRIDSKIIQKRLVKGNLVERLRLWIKDRNTLTHHYPHQMIDDEVIEQCAIDGYQLVRDVDAVVKAIKNSLKKKNKEDEKVNV